MASVLSPYATDWLDLVFRWFHVTAGIVWIGTSFYFVALDNHLEPAKDRDRPRRRNVGDPRRRLLPDREVPGCAREASRPVALVQVGGLLDVDLRLHALRRPLLLPGAHDAHRSVGRAPVDGGGSRLEHRFARCALARVRPALSHALSDRAYSPLVIVAAVAATSFGVTHLFAARAAYLQVGAMLGTIMVANVFFVIIPAHWELVRAKEAGREPDPRANVRGKQRSVHNNYFTLPVLFAMLAGHFSFTYEHAHSWAILVWLFLVGAAIRYYFNRRHAGRRCGGSRSHARQPSPASPSGSSRSRRPLPGPRP